MDALFGNAAAPAKAEEPPAPATKSPASATNDDSPPLTQEELDKVFGNTPEPQSVVSVVGDGGGKTDARPQSVEDLPEPESIPQSIAPDGDTGAPRRSRIGLIIAIIVFVIVAGGGGWAFFARDVVMRLVPITKEIYSMLGLSSEPVGAGLDIRGVASERANEGGVEVLLVRGLIANVSTVERPVPDLRVVLFDSNNRATQSTSAGPAKRTLPPGGELGFRIPLRDPSPLARRLEVTFDETAKPAKGAPPAPTKEPEKEPAPPQAPQEDAPQGPPSPGR